MDTTNQQCHHHGKMIVPILLILVIGTIVSFAILRDRIVNRPGWQATIIGHAKLAYQPDVVKVVLGVQVDKTAKAEDAVTKLNDKMTKIIPAVEKAGVTKENIMTQSYVLTPVYDTVDGVLATVPSGYTASQQILVKLTNVKPNSEEVSKAIAAAITAGATNVSGIMFEVANINDLKQQVLLMAMADAKAKANITAKAAGVKLGDVTGWWENWLQTPENPYYYPSYSMGYGMGGGGQSPVLPNGTQELIVDVSMNYELK